MPYNYDLTDKVKEAISKAGDILAEVGYVLTEIEEHELKDGEAGYLKIKTKYSK